MHVAGDAHERFHLTSSTLPTTQVQKLLLLYLEIIDKTDSNGKVLPEMILICQNLRNNLQHPNEYVRGSTLRFLCRLTETELLEPLVPSVMANLEHRHSFVRRNAVLAVMSIYQLPGGDMLMADAPEYIEKLLASESDLSTRRNAFLFLFNCAQDRAVDFLLSHLDQVDTWGDILQMVVLDLVRKVRIPKPNPDKSELGRVGAGMHHVHPCPRPRPQFSIQCSTHPPLTPCPGRDNNVLWLPLPPSLHAHVGAR